MPHPLKQKLKDGVVALSLSNLSFVGAWFSLFYDADFGFFNSKLVTPNTLLALAVNILWLASVIWIVMQIRRRTRNRLMHMMIHLAFFALLTIPIFFIRSQLSIEVYLLQFLKHPVGFAAAAAVGLIVLWKHRLIARVMAVVVAIFFPMAAFNLVRAALLCAGIIHLRQADMDVSLSPLVPVRENQPRVAWIVFDELDYRLVFEQPPAGFQFSEFNRLRDESLNATNANSPTDKTLFSMPSLMTGRLCTTAAYTNASDLVLTLKTGETTNWSKLPNVFSTARQLGVNTAVEGWYLPYDRLLSSNLNYCHWYPMATYQPARASNFVETLIRQIGTLRGPVHIHQRFIANCRNSMDRSISVVTNANYGLVLLHLFPPHSPGIYLPDTDSFSFFPQRDVTGYFNNVALADHWLGQMRCAMESSGQWDKSWIIISADHSWRGSRLYDGQRDFRVPFLVKAPGNGKEITFSRQMNTVLTHDLILAILRGEVADQGSAATWLDNHSSNWDATVSGDKAEQHRLTD